MGHKLSVVIITLNEARDLPRCLESVKDLGAEIVVLDNHSTDGTRELARKAGAVVAERTFDNYAAQKQAAVDLASGEWVLSLDADERLTDELREEIPRLISAANGVAGYDIPFEVHLRI